MYHRVLETVIVPDFSPRKNVKIQVNENENVQDSTDADELDELATSLPKPSDLAGFRLNPIDFEKVRPVPRC